MYKKNLQLKHWSSEDRPREKLIQQGAAQLSDAELLAIFLRTGIRGMNAVALARHLLSEFGGLRALLGASCESFCEQKGLGAAKYAQLQAVIEMARRYFGEEIMVQNAMECPEAVREFLLAKLQDEKHEVFAVMFLDNQFRVIRFEKVFTGTVDCAAVYPRVVVEKVLNCNATAVILAHNHPSGIAEPSNADVAITDRLKKALALIDVKVLDHYIIGHNVVSFAQRGLI